MKLINKMSVPVLFQEPGSKFENVVRSDSYSWHTCSYLQNGFPHVIDSKEETVLQFSANKSSKFYIFKIKIH